MKFTWLGLACLILVLAACEEPTPLRTSGTVDEPFLLQTDTFAVTTGISSFADTVNWSTNDYVHVGQTEAYVSGFSMTFIYADSLWKDTTLSSISLQLFPVGAFTSDSAGTLVQDSSITTLTQPFRFHDATGMSFDPILNPGTEWRTEDLVVKDTTAMEWKLSIDSSFLSAHDTLFTLGVTAGAGNQTLTTVYGATSVVRPRLVINHATPYLQPDSLGKDSSYSYILLADSMNAVVVEQSEAFNPALVYLRSLSGDGLRFGLDLTTWKTDSSGIRRILESTLSLNLDEQASRFYPVGAASTEENFNLVLENTDTGLQSTFAAAVGSGTLNGNLTTILQRALDAQADSLQLELRPSASGKSPAYLALSSGPDPVLQIRTTAARVEVTP